MDGQHVKNAAPLKSVSQLGLQSSVTPLRAGSYLTHTAQRLLLKEPDPPALRSLLVARHLHRVLCGDARGRGLLQRQSGARWREAVSNLGNIHQVDITEIQARLKHQIQRPLRLAYPNHVIYPAMCVQHVQLVPPRVQVPISVMRTLGLYGIENWVSVVDCLGSENGLLRFKTPITQCPKTPQLWLTPVYLQL